MKVWATVHYDNTFLVEVSAEASREEIEDLIFAEDENNSHNGDWIANYKIETDKEEE